MSYPEAVNLPFNAASIRGAFQPVMPGEPVPEGPGLWVVLQGNALVVKVDEQGAGFPRGDRPEWLEPSDPALCFGLWQGEPLWAVDIGRSRTLPAPFTAEPFNSFADILDDGLLTLGGLAHQILQWQRLCAVCSRCGGEVGAITGTWGKKCAGCGHEHYPHIHPCIIVLVRRGRDFLLIRKGEWPPGRYSLIAGFLDFGESLEECVQREVAEEAGVQVTNIRYVGSQSWPFPSQLMAGYVADYAGGVIRPDVSEIEDVRWFSPEELPESLPTRRSIARWIIDTFALS